MTKKIVSLVSLVVSAGAVAFTAIPTQAFQRASFQNFDATPALGVAAFALIALASSIVLSKLAFTRK